MIHLRAYAKLNLYLRVLGKRPDGYHEIETVFERIDLADELAFELQPRGLALTCDDPSLADGTENLVLTAARLLQQASGCDEGANLHLLKHIPVAAGLGGGSSDAATTLLGLNTLWQLQLSRARLLELASQLGSDVPFFLWETPFAIGRGRGEQLEPLRIITPLAHVVVVPDVRLSTQAVYEGLDAPLTATPSSISMVTHALRNGPDLAGLAEGLWNDLEPEAIRRCPVILRIHEQLRAAGSLATRLSGSGPAVFGLCRDQRNAQTVAATVRATAPPSWRIEVAQTAFPPSEEGAGWRSPKFGSRSVRSSHGPPPAADPPQARSV